MINMVYKSRYKEECIEWKDLNINEKEAVLMWRAGKECDEIKQITGLSWNKIEKLNRLVRKEG